MTMLGAELFVAARLAYQIVYLAGIAWLRTACWLASIAGLVLLFAGLI
jgi:uncharacterized MAPEG superfamily protein